MNKQVETNIPVIFQTLEKFDNGDVRFEKIRIWLMHTGLNLNGSIFEKNVVEKSIPSLANTPILAFIEENSDGDLDFSDHRMVLHRKEDGEVTLKYLGQAIGLIPETNNAHWETRVTDNGEEKEYLVVDGLIWTKWEEPLSILKERGLVAQSMELSENYTGHWNNKGEFVFDSFQFFGACLLGKEVLPAMKNSTAELQFSQNENLHQYIEQKLTEFNSMFSDKGGQTEMEQVNQETVETTEEVVVEETQVEEVTETIEENFEQTEEVVEETVETTESTEEVVDEEVTEEFTSETTEESAIVIEEDGTLVITNAEITTAEPTEDFEAKFKELDTNYQILLIELAELKEFKRNTLESELASKFTGQLSETELKEVFSTSKEKSLNDVEKDLYALVGKKNFSMTKSQSTKVKVSFSNTVEVNDNPYGSFFD